MTKRKSIQVPFSPAHRTYRVAGFIVVSIVASVLTFSLHSAASSDHPIQQATVTPPATPVDFKEVFVSPDSNNQQETSNQELILTDESQPSVPATTQSSTTSPTSNMSLHINGEKIEIPSLPHSTEQTTDDTTIDMSIESNQNNNSSSRVKLKIDSSQESEEEVRIRNRIQIKN